MLVPLAAVPDLACIVRTAKQVYLDNMKSLKGVNRVTTDNIVRREGNNDQDLEGWNIVKMIHCTT